MSEPLIMQFTPSQQDYAKVLRLFFFRRTSTQVSLGFLAIAFGLICYTVLTQGTAPSFFELIWLLLPPLFVAYVFFIQPSRMASRVIKDDQLAAETTLEVSDAGVKISNSFTSALLEWNNLQKLVVTKEYYLLLIKVNKNSFRFLPLRAFKTAQEKERFQSLVQQHLSMG